MVAVFKDMSRKDVRQTNVIIAMNETTLIPFSFNLSTISSSSIKAGMYMNDTTVLLEKTKEQS
jgi:hypothetical protein